MEYQEPENTDAARLDWLEQQDDMLIVGDLLVNWTWKGKRYAQGARAAIDAARYDDEQTGDDHG
jgi:hypothetical protein